MKGLVTGLHTSLLAAAFMFAASPVPSQAPFSVVPIDATIPPAQTGFVELLLTGGSGIDAYTLDFTFDPLKLEFLSVSKDSTLSQDFPMFGGNQVEPGHVRITGTALGTSPISADGVLLRIEIRSKAEADGSTVVCTDNLQADLRGADVGCATVTILQNTPTPAPTSTPTDTPAPTNTPTPTSTPTSTPTNTPVATNTPTITPTPTSTVVVVPVDATIPRGQTAFVDVAIADASEIDAYTIDIVIDSSKLEFVSVSNLGTLSEGFLVFGAELVSEECGRVTAQAVTASPISGDGTLFRVELRSKRKAKGSALVSTDNAQDDLQGASVGSGTVFITTESSGGKKDPSEKPSRGKGKR